MFCIVFCFGGVIFGFWVFVVCEWIEFGDSFGCDFVEIVKFCDYYFVIDEVCVICLVE